MNAPAANPPSGARRDRKPRAQLPLLDRLLEGESASPATGGGAGSALSAAEALERLRAAVVRDVEALLNARRRRVPLPSRYPELSSSLLTYGIPDPAAGAYLVPEVRASLAAEVESTLRRFEPRLTRISVSLLGEDDPLSGMLRLRVEAVLRAEPVPEPVSFETLLEPVTRDVTVRER